ncbi:efflux RND transporter periplasmic adaptor subunit [Polaromonas sp.]|uniref:efflux RND transporter periplasmic adaptor subunit n=1 Tax=Polaromonas sp. TaxID=1869339 RepID=UPI002FC9608A
MKSFKSNPIAITLIAVSTITVVALFAFSSRSGSASASANAAPPKPALTVTTAQPQQVRLPVKLAANGNITAWQEASVGTEANGLRLTEVHVNVGDSVRKGQVLATFAPDTVRADLAQARASLMEAEANAADAAANAERARTLQTSGALSASQINQYLTAEQTAKARVEVARAAFQTQQARLTQTQVLAPDHGVISARTATVGAVLASGTELFRLIRQGRLEWRAEVTSAELGRITKGTTAQVTAASGARLAGRVRMIGPTVDPQTRAALVYVDLTPLPGNAATSTEAPKFSAGPPQGKLAPIRRERGSATPEAREATSVGAAKAGMFARGEFDLGNTSALTVPQAAVVVRDGFSYVYRLGPDNRVSQVKVQTGRLAADRVEITGGLNADARLVVQGAGFLNDGDLVRIADAQPNQATAPVTPASAATK